jgi:hypothetical protein
LILQIYTPLAFRYYGAEEAGRVGFSIAVWTAIISLANIWTVSVLPKINFLVATKNWQILDRIVWRRFIAGEITLIFAGIMFFIVYLILARHFPISGRFTSVASLLILFVIWIIQYFINTMTVYLRAHKEEPFYLIFLCTAFFVICATFISTKLFSSEYIFYGFLSANILFLPWYYSVFKKCRRNWHTTT